MSSAPQQAPVGSPNETGMGSGAAPPTASMEPGARADTMAPPPSTYISSSAAVETGRDSTRRFIRKADLRFKVDNVIKATYAIEDITRHHDGFVTSTRLNSTIDNKTVIAVSADSSLETTYYTVANQMELRVPNTSLDSTLKEIAAHIDFLDHRVITATDIAPQVLANELARRRLARHQSRLTGAIDTRGRRLEETTTAEESLLNRQAESDNALLSNLSLQDQVEYSTVTLAIYQRQSVLRELIANDKNIDEYKPGIGTRILEALENGWWALVSVLVFLAEIWWLIAGALLVWILLGRFGPIFRFRPRRDPRDVEKRNEEGKVE